MLDKIAKELADQILALIAPELEKAEKWEKVAPLISGDCNSCPAFNYCTKNDIHPCEIVRDALNQPEVKP